MEALSGASAVEIVFASVLYMMMVKRVLALRGNLVCIALAVKI
jgi:hypothetical protein